MGHLDFAHRVEQLAGKVQSTSNARSGVIDLHFAFSGVGQKFGQSLGRYRGVNHHQQAVFTNQRNGCEVRYWVVGQCFFDHRHVGVSTVGGEKQLVSIRRSFADVIAANAPAATGPIFNDDVLPQISRHGLGKNTTYLI